VTLEVVGGRGSVEVLCDSAATNKHVIYTNVDIREINYYDKFNDIIISV